MKVFYSILATGIKKIHPVEIVLLILAVAGINYFYYPYDPGFFLLPVNPYLLAVLLFAVLYGKGSGFFSLLTSILLMALLVAWDYLSVIFSDPGMAAAVLTGGVIMGNFISFISISIMTAFIAGDIRDHLGSNIAALKSEKEKLNGALERQRTELHALAVVNDEYQERILGQQNSLISLYTTMVALNSLNLESIYPNILDAVIKFTGATRCSLWIYHREEREIELAATSGWEGGDERRYITLPDSQGLIGWAARNNVLFSVKMLQKYRNLMEMDNGTNIITAPIDIEGEVWGIINIEKMPFVKYNLYSEQLVMMIADLSAPAIRNARRFIDITMKGEVEPVTGFSSLDELFLISKEEFNRARAHNVNLSFAIVEMANFEAVSERYRRDDALAVLRELSKLVLQLSKGSALIFQYKEINQFAVILPNLDYDGAAVFCLNLIEANTRQRYAVGADTVVPEILLGYGNVRPNHRSELDMIELAENLLAMQKI